MVNGELMAKAGQSGLNRPLTIIPAKSAGPTPKRLEEAIRRGDVVKSAEVNTWFMIAAGTLLITVFAAPMATSLEATFRGLLAKSYQIRTDGPVFTQSVRNAGDGCRWRVGYAAPSPLYCCNCRQFRATPLRFLDEPIKPQLSRISPSAGFGRMFSGQALANFAKGLAKLGVVGAVLGGTVVAAASYARRSVSADPILICR